jgi:hypothetical protein
MSDVSIKNVVCTFDLGRALSCPLTATCLSARFDSKVFPALVSYCRETKTSAQIFGTGKVRAIEQRVAKWGKRKRVLKFLVAGPRARTFANVRERAFPILRGRVVKFSVVGPRARTFANVRERAFSKKRPSTCEFPRDDPRARTFANVRERAFPILRPPTCEFPRDDPRARTFANVRERAFLGSRGRVGMMLIFANV